MNHRYRRETEHLSNVHTNTRDERSPHRYSQGANSLVSNNPTRGGEEHRTIENHSSYALRNRSRDGSAISLERSKSPQFSQASNIIRRKYS